MSVFFEIGKTCTRSTKQAAEKQAFGQAAGKFFSFLGRNPRLTAGGLAGLGLGAAGANELAAGHNLPHLGGSAERPLWHPGTHGLAVNPHTQGWGTATWRAMTRPLQTYRQFAGTNPGQSQPATLQDIISGGMQNQQLKYNPKTGKIDIVGGSYDMHPLYKQQWERVQKEHQMFSKLFGLDGQAGSPPATPPATPPAPTPAQSAVPQIVRNSFGPLHMNDYSKVPNVSMPSVH